MNTQPDEPVTFPALDPAHIVEPGYCSHCDKEMEEVMDIAYMPGNSGPGYTVKACVPHTRQLAAYQSAPAWLRADLAALDALRAGQGPGPRSVPE